MCSEAAPTQQLRLCRHHNNQVFCLRTGEQISDGGAPREQGAEIWDCKEQGGFIWLYFGDPETPLTARPKIPTAPELDSHGARCVAFTHACAEQLPVRAADCAAT